MNDITPDNKGHIRDSKGALIKKEPEDKGYPLWVINKKTEKLTTAIYLITDFFDSREEMKWSLREHALSFMTAIASLGKEDAGSLPEARLRDIRGVFDEVVSRIDIAARAYLISRMNASILREEYGDVYRGTEVVLRFGDGPVGGPELDGAALREPATPRSKKDNKGQKDKRKMSFTTQKKDGDGAQAGEFDDVKDTNEQSISLQRDARRNAIIGFLRARGRASIKDISTLIPDTSQKTIQRELMSLIDSGVVQKEGERRWSSYVLKKDDPA